MRFYAAALVITINVTIIVNNPNLAPLRAARDIMERNYWIAPNGTTWVHVATSAVTAWIEIRIADELVALDGPWFGADAAPTRHRSFEECNDYIFDDCFPFYTDVQEPVPAQPGPVTAEPKDKKGGNVCISV